MSEKKIKDVNLKSLKKMAGIAPSRNSAHVSNKIMISNYVEKLDCRKDCRKEYICILPKTSRLYNNTRPRTDYVTCLVLL